MSRFATLNSLRPAWPILAGAAMMLSLSMGLRQSLGLFMPAITQGIALSVADFTLAIAVQNLAWGLLQPLAGAWAVRVGFRPMMVAGAALYVAALLMLAGAQGLAARSRGAVAQPPRAGDGASHARRRAADDPRPAAR